MLNNESKEPLGEVYLKNVAEQDNTIELNYDDKFATFLNIQKSLKPYVLSKLKENRVATYCVFPDYQDLKQITLTETLTNL